MILAVKYKELFVRNQPSFARQWFPEVTDEMSVNWVIAKGDHLIYEYFDGSMGGDFLSAVKSYETYPKSKLTLHKTIKKV